MFSLLIASSLCLVCPVLHCDHSLEKTELVALLFIGLYSMRCPFVVCLLYYLVSFIGYVPFCCQE